LLPGFPFTGAVLIWDIEGRMLKGRRMLKEGRKGGRMVEEGRNLNERRILKEGNTLKEGC
jgi:hypothetical protein